MNKNDSLHQTTKPSVVIFDNPLIDSCINWLGYGEIDSPYWFIGVEESGAEIKWKDHIKSKGTLTLEKSLSIRKNFSTVENINEVWKKYGHELANVLKGPTTWRFIAAFLIEFGEKKANTISVRNFILEEFGLSKGDHFICEFYPLPKRKSNNWEQEYIENYKLNKDDYYEKIKSYRLTLFKEQIKLASKLKLIISYNKEILEIFRCFNPIYEKCFKEDKFSLYKLKIEQKGFYLLITPFFGNGRISYDEIKNVVKKLKYYIK